MFGIQRNVQPRTRLEPPSQQQVPCNLFNEIFKIVTPLPIFLGVPTNVVSQLADRLKIRRNYVGAVLGGAGSNHPEPPIVSHSSKPKEEPHQSIDWVSRFTANHDPTTNRVPSRTRANQIGEIATFAEGRQAYRSVQNFHTKALFGPSKLPHQHQSFVRSFQNSHTNIKLITTLCL